MSLYLRINILISILLIALSTTFLIGGHIGISKGLSELNERLFLSETKNIVDEFSAEQKRLKESGFSELPDVVKETQTVLIKNLKNFSIGKTGKSCLVDNNGVVIDCPLLTKTTTLTSSNFERVVSSTKDNKRFFFTEEGKDYIALA